MRRSYRMDLIARVYACVASARWRNTFRFTAVLTENVDPVVLKQAMDDILPRFPYFTVSLRQGFFWHYLQESDQSFIPEDDGGIPFADAGQEPPLFRICYHGRKISLEMQHLLTDGYGSVIFLKTLLAQYFILKGIPVAPTHGVLDIREMPEAEEYEDSLFRYCRPGPLHFKQEARAYHVEEKTPAGSRLTVSTGIMNVQDVRKKARERQASITEYLGAVLLVSLQKQQIEEHPGKSRPVILSVSADLRRFYPAGTEWSGSIR